MPVLVAMCILHSWELRGDLKICAMWESNFGKVTFALEGGCFVVLCSNLVMVVRGRQRRGPSCWAGRCGGGWARTALLELATSTIFLHKGLAYLLTYFCACLCISMLVVMCILHSWELCSDLQICAMWESDLGKVTFALAGGCFAVLCSNLVMVVRGRQRCGPSCWAGRCGGGVGPPGFIGACYLNFIFARRACISVFMSVCSPPVL